jgi:hypothetical protein
MQNGLRTNRSHLTFLTKRKQYLDPTNQNLTQKIERTGHPVSTSNHAKMQNIDPTKQKLVKPTATGDRDNLPDCELRFDRAVLPDCSNELGQSTMAESVSEREIAMRSVDGHRVDAEYASHEIRKAEISGKDESEFALDSDN